MDNTQSLPRPVDPVERLRALTASPYPPEPPRRSRIVDAAMKVRRRGNARGVCVTPHLHGGSPADKAQYEYDTAPTFWSGFRCGIEILAGRDVVDVGCGWGGKATFLAEHSGLRSITGFDLPGVFDPGAATAFARSRGVDNCAFETGLAEDMPLPDASFDVAMLDDVLEHVADPERTLAECRRVLRPGGLLLVKFPSIRMMQGHHLDRALTYPGLHYVLSFKRWAAGLNDLLLRSDGEWTFEPFDEVVETKYHPGLTRNLNGLDFAQLRRIAERQQLAIEQLDLVPLSPSANTVARRARAVAYRALWSLPPLKEPLSNRIVFVGRRP
jgi:2-polyprenyl-3-methyl-5-hydroxy-6-metoxy-1,4-benzoquinol methylase